MRFFLCRPHTQKMIVTPTGHLRGGDATGLETFNRKVLESVEQLLSEGEVNSIIHLAYKNEVIIEIGRLADDPGVPFEHLVNNLNNFCQEFAESEVLDMSFAIGTRVSLIRRFLSDQLEYIECGEKIPSACERSPDILKTDHNPG